jgi:enoyl-CoA hydratase/carnithine racemase
MAVLTDVRSNVLCITISRPEVMNALDPETAEQLKEALISFRNDPELRVCILTGAGDKAFCTGADMVKTIGKAVSGNSNTNSGTDMTGLSHGYYGLNIWKPMIAAINGHCLAGGLGLALMCDIRICSENATFGTVGTSRGIMPGAGQTQRLPRVIPMSTALELFFTSRRIDAWEAYRIGLVNRVVPHDELIKTAYEMADAITANAPLAIQACKEACLRGIDLSLEEGLMLEVKLGAKLFSTTDALEGTKAFIEKRQARFQGK